jgi:lipooligosaccharide transport system permease protein
MLSVVALLRPSAPRAAGAARIIERNLLLTRNHWLVFISGVVEPVIYLFAIDVGLGQLVGDVTGPNGTPVGYAAFAAPALLAASAMNGAVYESTFNIFFRLRYGKLYDAILATPMTPTDVALGEIGWSQLRGLAYAAAFMVVMGVMGLISSPLDVYPRPVQLLTQLSPLYHGVALIRGLTLGALDWSLFAHVAFLLVMALVGGVLAARRLHARLLP